jgi:hypothetical protein
VAANLYCTFIWCASVFDGGIEMTQDEIVKMAREAGLVRTGNNWVEPARWGVTELVHFAVLVAAAERDRMCQQFNIPKELAHEKATGNEAD